MGCVMGSIVLSGIQRNFKNQRKTTYTCSIIITVDAIVIKFLVSVSSVPHYMYPCKKCCNNLKHCFVEV